MYRAKTITALALAEQRRTELPELANIVFLGEFLRHDYCVATYQSPGVDGEPVLTVDVRPGEEGELWLEVVARPHVLDGVQDLSRVGGGFLLNRELSYGPRN